MERTIFCSCKSSCQRKTGPKRVGCPCKDDGLHCCEKCECDTKMVCQNNKHPARADSAQRQCSTEDDLADKVRGLVIDEASAQGTVTNDGRSLGTKDNNSKTRNAIPQALLRRVHRINKGYALVIHNRKFRYNLRPREGSEKDLEAIKIFCEEAGFTVNVRENLRVTEIRRLCRELTENEDQFHNYDGFVCFILSHGNSSGICGVLEETIAVKDIVAYFKDSGDLLDKPKLFFIQACRAGGMIEDDGVEKDHQKRLCPPDSSDILVAHSTIEGTLSYRDIRNGSWFVQTLIKQLKENAQCMHLMDIMTVVNEDIAGSELEGYRQMPVQVTTLTKFVYFKMASVAKVTARNTRTVRGVIQEGDDESSCAPM